MSPRAQQIAIAEACGWTLRPYGDMLVWYDPQGRACPVELGHRNDCLPNYLNNLNAMHEAEKILDDGVLWKGYLNRLWDVVCPQFHQMSGLNAAVGLLLVHATAAQRAEAFLKTLKLWQE